MSRDRFRYDQVNQAMKGRLDWELRRRRARGDSFADIAFALRQRTGVPVSFESIREWCRVAGIRAESK